MSSCKITIAHRKINYLLLLFLFGLSSTFGQTLRLGILGSFVTGNKYIEYQFGPGISAEYQLKNLPFSITSNIRVWFTQYSGIFSSYNNSGAVVSLSANYYPVKWAIEPYAGIGIAGNFSNLTRGGNGAAHTYKGFYISAEGNNTFSFEITGGVKLAANSPINVIVEFTQSFSQPVVVQYRTEYLAQTFKTEKVYLYNSLYIKIGILFRIAGK